MKVKILDNQFSHAQSAGSKNIGLDLSIEWFRNFNVSDLQDNEPLIITESFYWQSLNINHNNKILWLLESPVIIDYNIINDINLHYDQFKLILTNHPSITTLHNVNIFPPGGCWIFDKDHSLYQKSKLVSTIASDKIFTSGQSLRHQAIHKNPKIDPFGPSYVHLDYKLDALKNYKYHLCVENTKSPWYFSEKLIDCFVTGTIPIYYGCENLDYFGFDLNGIIIVDNLNDINNVLINLDNININFKSIQNNYYNALLYTYPENRIKDILN